MAKLNGITVLGLVSGEVIVHNGQHFVASTERAAVGDILKRVETSSRATFGGFYSVVRLDGCNDPHVIDDKGDDFDASAKGNWTVYKPLKAPTSVAPTTSFTEVKRKAVAGETIKIVAAFAACGKYVNGDILTVDCGTSSSGVYVSSAKAPNGGNASGFIADREYVVLEPAPTVSTPRPYQTGDVVRSKSSSMTYTLTERKPEFDGAGYGIAWGSVGNYGYIGESQFTLVTPVTEKPITPAAPVVPTIPYQYHVIGKDVYRRESRKAVVGEKILVLSQKPEDHASAAYAKPELVGRVLTVEQVDSVGDIPEVSETSMRGYIFYSKREYAVLTPISDALGIDGVAYKMVKRTAKIGEKFMRNDGYSSYHVSGTVYTAISVDGTGVRHDSDGPRLWHGNYDVLEPLATSSTSTPVLPAPVFAVGDTVKLTIAAGKYPEHGYGNYVKNGDIGIVKTVKPDGAGLQVDFPEHSRWNGLLSEFTLAPKPRLAIGSYAKIVVANTGQNSVIPLGTIVEIVKDDSSDVPYCMRTLDGKTERWAAESHIVVATQTEIDAFNAKRLVDEKTAAETALWTAIGRKVNELRNGDVVKVTMGCGGHANGTIGICRSNATNTHVDVEANGIRYRGAAELVTPVESVFTK